MVVPHILLSSLKFNECSDVFSLLSQFKYAYIKGEAISHLAFGKLGQRTSQDIDLLICRKDIKDIEGILTATGFHTRDLAKEDRITAVAYSHQIPPYRRKGKFGNTLFDLNFDILWGEYTGPRINIDKFLIDTIEMEIYGVRVKTLPPLKAMVQLILHHYKEMNSLYHLSKHNCINYRMFNDVYYLWKNNQEAISLDKLISVSSEYKIMQYVFYILYFTNKIFNDPDLEKYVVTFNSCEGQHLLDYYGLTSGERKKWKVDFFTRVNSQNLYKLIIDDLTELDLEKIKANQRIFG